MSNEKSSKEKLMDVASYISIPLAVVGVVATWGIGGRYVTGCLIVFLIQLLFCVSALLWTSREDREEFFTPDLCIKWRFGILVHLLCAPLFACSLIWLGEALGRNCMELKESFSGFPGPVGLLAVTIFWVLLFIVAAVAETVIWMNLTEHCLARWANRRDFHLQTGLVADSQCNREQNEFDMNYIGGWPLMAGMEDFPVCSDCGEVQTLFFQITFPEKHRWHGYTLSAFLCTSCMSSDHCIPEMLGGVLRNADIPAGFMENYQKNFRFVVTPLSECVIRTDYIAKIRFQPLVLQKNLPRLGWAINMESPDWIEEDESPGSYASSEKMVFLCQVAPDYRFPLVTAFIRDMIGNQLEEHKTYYEYFIGNSIYLFGPENPETRLVYALPQAN